MFSLSLYVKYLLLFYYFLVRAQVGPDPPNEGEEGDPRPLTWVVSETLIGRNPKDLSLLLLGSRINEVVIYTLVLALSLSIDQFFLTWTCWAGLKFSLR
ncbi:hypothetical protein F4775DRAFT_533435 [Biscogniauxia sp. FL1348]|nr:hypothetical protein F4775DRAFT_533435 [Biscogniauxia sp. FL1348]